MDFREFAAKESSAFVDRLTAIAAAQAETARQHAEAEAQKQHAESQKTIDGLRAEVHQLTAHNEKLETSVRDLRAETEALQAKVKAEADRAAAARAAQEEADHERRRAEAATDEEARAKTAAEKAKAAAESELQKVRAALVTAQAQLDAADKARQKVATQLQADAKRLAVLEKTIGDHVETRKQLEAKLQAAGAAEKALRAKMSEPQPLDRLLATFQQLRRCDTARDVLTALVDGLATEFTRVALFSVTGNHLEGMHQVGFDFKSDISKVVIPMTMDSLLTQAVSSGRVQGFRGNELTDSSCAPFGGSPAFVLTLPIAVRDETLAVIYADTGDEQAGATPDRGVKFAELLLWHAVPMLAKLSAELESVAELRNYATLLLNEIEYMYTADVTSGTEGDELRTHLRDNLDCAKRLYSQRIESEGLTGAPALDEQLASFIDSKAGTPFGQDLAIVAGRAEAAPGRRSARRTAEAS
jgi:hypothetical protein